MISASVDPLVHIPTETVRLAGPLSLPAGPHGIVVFVPGHDHSRDGLDTTVVEQIVRAARLGTLFLDCLTPEAGTTWTTGADLSLLTHRLITATQWLQARPETTRLGSGYYGANTGAAVALQAASEMTSSSPVSCVP